MSSAPQAELRDVGIDSELYAAVLALWRRESATLGFLPEGGFEDAARSRSLLAAVAPSGEIAGYVLYRRRARGVVVVVHLCVSVQHRGRGVAHLLMTGLRLRCSDAYELRLRCRRDFPANGLWPRVGFVAVGEVPGRGRDRAPLTVWRLELSPLPLLRRLSEGTQTRAVAAVIDANVFFDLDAPTQECAALLADWLGELVELHVTNEIYNEIDRNEDAHERERQRRRVGDFAMAPRDATREEALLRQVEGLFASDVRPSTRSDRRQLAMAVSGGIAVFVTRDGAILRAADHVYDVLGLRVLTPIELIRTADELRREEEYRPQMFAGPSLTSRAARWPDLDRLEAMHHAGECGGEPRLETRSRLRHIFSDPQRYQAICVETRGELLAGYVLERPRAELLAVPFFAVATSSLGQTAARQLGEWIISTAANEGRVVVHAADPPARVSEALEDLGFSREPHGWIRLAPGIVGTADVIAAAIDVAGSAVKAATTLANRFSQELRGAEQQGQDAAAEQLRRAAVERALWPAKLTGWGIRNFILAIKPYWAHELFDRGLAGETLFGADPTLILRHENIYYRSPTPAVLEAPSRVLWYVTQSSRYAQSGAVRACSRIEDVEVGDPKALFSRYKRLGVYAWPNVLEASRNDRVMAIRFTQTELFRTPVPWSELQVMLRQHTGKGRPLQGPASIPESCFADIYGRGMSSDA